MNVHEYFKQQLGVAPNEDSLRELPIDSPCGLDCKRAIDTASEFLKACDGHPEVRNLTIQAVNHTVETFWLG